MENGNTNPITNTNRFCGSCGKELISGCQFCPYCGHNIDFCLSNNKKPTKKNGLIITLISIILVLLVVIGVILGGGIPFSPNNSNSNSDNLLKTNKKLTAQKYVEKVLLEEYQLAETNLTLNYKYIDGEPLVDCTDFQDTLLGYRIGDFNNDGDDDIYAVKLYKSSEKERDDNYGKLEIESCVLMANDYGGFNDCYTRKEDLYYDYGDYTSLNDHYQKTYQYTVYQTSDSKWYLIASDYIEDDRELYKDNGPFYSIEDSIGDFNINFSLAEISNSGVSNALTIMRSIGHMGCMPKAENYSYNMGTNGGNADKLFDGGVTGYSTSSVNPTPSFTYTNEGSCASESSACEKINTELDKYELQDYHLSTFKWEDRFENSLILDKDSMNPIYFETSTVVTDKESGKFMINFK